LRGLGIALLGLALLSGCQGAANAGKRVAEDGFVVVTSPLQIPTMAARDAATNFESPAASAAMFPITFPLFILEHAMFTVIHAVDLVAFPVHFFHDVPSTSIYRAYGLPLERGPGANMINDALGGVAIATVAIGLPLALSLASLAAF
jgi:hypothetical protein